MRLCSNLIGSIIFMILSLTNTHILESEFVPNKFTIDDFKIFDSKLGVSLHIGMKEEEIIKLYGKSKDTTIFGDQVYDGLKVFYRNHVAVRFKFSTSDNLTSRYKTYREIGLGDTKEKILANYGEDFADISNLHSATEITYILKVTDQNVETENKNDPFWGIDNQKSLYYIHFLCDNNVANITIGDAKSVLLSK